MNKSNKIINQIKSPIKWTITICLSIPVFSISAQTQHLPKTNIDSVTFKGENGQDWGSLIEEILENSEDEKDPTLWQDQLSDLADNPVSLNTATKESLESIPFLTEDQVEALSYYIYRYGPLVSLSELLLVEGIDEQTLRWLKPFVILGDPVKSSQKTLSLKKMLSYGKQEIRTSCGQFLQDKLGYKNAKENILADSAYQGDPRQIRFRYGFNYKNKLQWGLIMEKDAGEKLWNKHNNGIDYTSFHLLIKDQRKLKELVLGDYNLRLGQGLVCSSYFSLGKNTSGSTIEQTGSIINRHFSSSESGFFRGLVLTYIIKPFTQPKDGRGAKYGIELTTFGSSKKIDGKITEGYFTTISSTELHRTQKEIDINDKIKLWAIGSHIVLRTEKGQFGITGLAYKFSAYFDPLWKPYNCFYFRGKQNGNLSVDYRALYKKALIFGEMAIDEKLKTAILAGLVLKPYSRLDISFLGRSYAPEYNAYYANAFSEGSAVKNEYGLFSSGEWRLFKRWRLNFYCDIYIFPWLKYRIDSPSTGYDYAFQATFKPSTESEILLRLKTKVKDINTTDSQSKLPLTESQDKKQIRLQLSSTQGSWGIKTLMDGNCVSILTNQSRTYGLSLSQEIDFSPFKRNFSISLKYTMFDTDNFDNRIYSYEKNYPGSFSIPSFYGEGDRFGFLLKYKFSSKLDIWVKIGHSAYSDRDCVGTGLEQVQGNSLTNISSMIRLKF